jgi:hypothetical protein
MTHAAEARDIVRLADIAKVVRSKNAKPFRLTLDILFASEDVFRYVLASGALSPKSVAGAYGLDPAVITSSYVFPEGLAFKFTLKRPIVQGGLGESDVYGAQQHAPLLDIPIPCGPDAPEPIVRAHAAMREAEVARVAGSRAADEQQGQPVQLSSRRRR